MGSDSTASEASSAKGGAARRYRPGYDLVAEQVLHYIAEQNLRPGDRLPTEQGLAEILGATRNVTREAVKVLAAMGRLNVRKGAGIFVAEPSGGPLSGEALVHFQPTELDQVVMLFDHRILLEGETARRAASMATPIEVRSIREGARRSIEAAAQDNANDFAEADAQFHGAVAAAAHNMFLEAGVAGLRQLAVQSDLLLFHGDVPGSFVVAADQHLAVAEAIADGDAQSAAALMAEHINTTRDQFERRIRDRLARLVSNDRPPTR
ncbi:GntR family transcriptional regulator [Planotetraspora thailandica]|uniref:GntR family transcriptional regulator n=1 Tax=Planotetraspora thailandica TaxID=487172 RepID=A0A8J4DGP3_9ACTN|nr:FCD domain-containing protein [Planotetraspora thailandica]GII59777.1 GntR family transcriptional regulator [Planotetraspora thailandica]